MTKIEKVLYTGKTHATRGRDGTARIDDAQLNVKLSPPATASLAPIPRSPLQKANIAALGFISRRPNWFPAGSVVKAVAAAASILRAAPERILYGYSQGGYARSLARPPRQLAKELSQ
jgi:hypothetical protein